MQLKTNNQNANEIKSLWRNFQIRLIEGYKFQINEKNCKEFINSNRYSAYTEFTPGEIITGSTALNLFGLLSRKSHDIDVLTLDATKYGKLSQRMYSNEVLENFLGTKIFSYKKYFFSTKERYEFDFFKYVNNEFIELDLFTAPSGLKVELPTNIIIRKIEIADKFGIRSGEKHYEDVKQILNKFYEPATV